MTLIMVIINILLHGICKEGKGKITNPQRSLAHILSYRLFLRQQ